MEVRDMGWVVTASGGELRCGDPTTRVTGITTDSRVAGPGDLFVALRGDRFDGHDFVSEVMGRGVAGVMVARARAGEWDGLGGCVVAVDETRGAMGRMAAVYRGEFAPQMVCVAGSNGKTTTKELLAAILGTCGPVLRSEASFNNDVGVPLTLLRLGRGDRVAVLEAGTNRPGELAVLLGMIRPRIGVLTGIGREHLEHFVDLAGVAQEEGSLAEALDAEGLLVLNGDAPFAEAIAARSRARVLRFGFGEGNAWRVVRHGSTWEGEEFELATPRVEWAGRWRVGVPGRHMAGNAAAALVVAAELGVDAGAARQALAEFRGARRRMEVVESGGVRILDDCYNANADSMGAALDTLGALPCEGRRIAVLGDMAELGETSAAAHEEIGRRVARVADLFFAVGTRSGGTAGAAVAEGMKRVWAASGVDEVMPWLKTEVRAGDVVLVKASRSSRLERVTAGLVSQLRGEETH